MWGSDFFCGEATLGITHDAWYRFVAPHDGTYNVSLCSDTDPSYGVRLAMYDTSSCDLLEEHLIGCVARTCRHDNLGYVLELEAGQEILFQVGAHPQRIVLTRVRLAITPHAGRPR